MRPEVIAEIDICKNSILIEHIDQHWLSNIAQISISLSCPSISNQPRSYNVPQIQRRQPMAKLAFWWRTSTQFKQHYTASWWLWASLFPTNMCLASSCITIPIFTIQMKTGNWRCVSYNSVFCLLTTGHSHKLFTDITLWFTALLVLRSCMWQDIPYLRSLVLHCSNTFSPILQVAQYSMLNALPSTLQHCQENCTSKAIHSYQHPINCSGNHSGGASQNRQHHVNHSESLTNLLFLYLTLWNSLKCYAAWNQSHLAVRHLSPQLFSPQILHYQQPSSLFQHSESVLDLALLILCQYKCNNII